MSRAAAASSGSLAQRASRTFEIALTTVIAWAFGLVSAGVLVYIASGLWRGEYAVATPLSAADPAIVSEVASARPYGLAFEGRTGAMLAAGEAAMVMVALGLSMMFAGNPRRLGLLAMFAWAGLWAVDGAVVVAHTWTGMGFSAAMPVYAGAGALLIVFGCMVHRMMLLWPMRPVMM